MIMMMIIMIPIEVTVVGIVTDVSDVHPSKAEASYNRVRVNANHDVVDDESTNSSNSSINSN
jgi:hypothetical protein